MRIWLGPHQGGGDLRNSVTSSQIRVAVHGVAACIAGAAVGRCSDTQFAKTRVTVSLDSSKSKAFAVSVFRKKDRRLLLRTGAGRTV